MLALLPYPRIDPVIFHLGPLAPRWYGLAYVAGFLLGYALLRRMVRSGALRISAEALSDLMIWLLIAVIVGGRAGEWLFYHHNIDHPEPWWEPFAVWHGGMSFHGGLLGVLAVLTIFTRRRKLPFWHIADALALVAPIGLFFGRIANFINAELVGREADVPWAMIFPRDHVARHPSQLYEAILEGPVLLGILWLARRAHPRDGRLAALFVICYGLIRFAVEFTREPDANLGFLAFGWLTMGQLLSLGMTAAGIAMWLALRRRPPS